MFAAREMCRKMCRRLCEKVVFRVKNGNFVTVKARVMRCTKRFFLICRRVFCTQTSLLVVPHFLFQTSLFSGILVEISLLVVLFKNLFCADGNREGKGESHKKRSLALRQGACVDVCCLPTVQLLKGKTVKAVLRQFCLQSLSGHVVASFSTAVELGKRLLCHHFTSFLDATVERALVL